MADLAQEIMTDIAHQNDLQVPAERIKPNDQHEQKWERSLSAMYTITYPTKVSQDN